MKYLERLFYLHYELTDKVILPACSKAAGREITTFTSILDLKGVGMTDMMSTNVYKMSSIASKMAQDYYPEFVHKSFVINAPMLFSGFFNLIKPLLNNRTQALLAVTGSKYQKELLTVIDENVLPIEFGGKNTAPLDRKDKGFYVPEMQLCMKLKKWDLEPQDYALLNQGGPGMPQFPQFPGQPQGPVFDSLMMGQGGGINYPAMPPPPK